MADVNTPAEQTQALPQNWPVAQGRPEDYFPTPSDEAGIFELGLVLGGTVSAGTFTAGVLDFLFEALDAWDEARLLEEADKPYDDDDNRPVPKHHVRIRIMTGASGGGINALLMARALHYRFPHVTMGSAAAMSTPSPNPFYEVWVNDIDITGLLDVSDLDTNQQIVSLLNGNILQSIADGALQYPSEAQNAAGNIVDSASRSWIYNPLTIVVTHTNLAGIPYAQVFSGVGVTDEYFTNHADYARVYAGYSAPPGAAPLTIKYLPDAVFLNVPATFTLAPARVIEGPTVIQWEAVAQNALGTSAFPIGLPARVIQRGAATYAYRFVWNNQTGKYDWIVPKWEKIAPDATALQQYAFTSLDGGCTDNEPIMLASQTLEGLETQQHVKSADTSGASAHRAIVLVDPLCDPPPQAAPSAVLALQALLGPTIHMLVGANRFATADMADFLSPNVYTRFLIAPKRITGMNTIAGGQALCSEGLGAFLGFMSRSFRDHDFMLGRRNCQAFLTGTFTLSQSNKGVFIGPFPQLPGGYQGPTPRPGECPIIPLYGSAKTVQPQPPWPVGKFNPDSLNDALISRIALMLERLGGFLDMSWIDSELITPLARHIVAPNMARKIISVINNELKRKQL
ncbi:hypothetical protein P3T43_006609 [Paraburkholderia sp. GAS41]|uniref:hypothetical protein n=1 Tax=Paraburkholderia sp. GAS41 TaxID=3035134 RepID=UPI003D2595AA